jgi:hypothetical protein
LTLAYLPSTGALVGTRLYDGTDHATDQIVDIAAGTGAVFVTGESLGAGSNDDFLTAAYRI